MDIVSFATKEVVEYANIVYERIFDILSTPAQYPDMLWVLVPLIATTLLMEFYFGVYKEELLGWNTAFSNSLVLIFVAADLSRYLSENNLLGVDVKTLIVLVVVAGGVFLTAVDFFHLLPERLAFNVSAKSPMNFIAIAAILLVYSSIPLDVVTLIAFIAIFIAMLILFWILHQSEPSVHGELTQDAPVNESVRKAPIKE